MQKDESRDMIRLRKLFICLFLVDPGATPLLAATLSPVTSVLGAGILLRALAATLAFVSVKRAAPVLKSGADPPRQTTNGTVPSQPDRHNVLLLHKNVMG